jgi:hypothetical protein
VVPAKNARRRGTVSAASEGVSQNNFSYHQHEESSLYCRARRQEVLLVRVFLGMPGCPVVPANLQ